MTDTSVLSKIRQISKENHAKNGLISYVVFFFSSLFCAGFVLINLLFPALFIITVPFFVIPLLFAAQFATSAIGEGQFLSLKGFFICFGIYFSEHFRSTYRVIRSALISFGIFLALSLTSNIIVFSSFNSTNYLNTQAFVQDVMNSNMSDITVIEALIDQYRFLLDTYLICTLLPTLVIFVFLSTYFMSLNSYSMFYRIARPEMPGRALMFIYDRTLKANRKLFVRCHWGMNYPLVILFILGFALGGFVGYLYKFDYNSIFTFGLAIAIFISFTFFGPKYFANKQAIADYMSPNFYSEINKMKPEVDITEILKNLNINQDDTKKDSEES